jgi:hypothetical protein
MLHFCPEILAQLGWWDGGGADSLTGQFQNCPLDGSMFFKLQLDFFLMLNKI